MINPKGQFNMVKFLITAAAIIFFGVAGAQYARADECQITKTAAHDIMAKMEGTTVRDLTKSEIEKVIDKKGLPPNAEGTEGLEMELVSKENLRAINIYQNGCFINRLGPTSPEAIDKLFGAVPA